MGRLGDRQAPPLSVASFSRPQGPAVQQTVPGTPGASLMLPCGAATAGYGQRQPEAKDHWEPLRCLSCLVCGDRCRCFSPSGWTGQLGLRPIAGMLDLWLESPDVCPSWSHSARVRGGLCCPVPGTRGSSTRQQRLLWAGGSQCSALGEGYWGWREGPAPHQDEACPQGSQ